MESKESVVPTPSASAPECGLYIVLPETTDHEKQNFQLGQALHGANRFSTYALNRHIVELRHLPSENAADIARNYVSTCKRNGFIFLMHDNPELARDVGADGITCSALDKVTHARKTMGEDAIIGMRCATLNEAKSALEFNLDFVSFYSAPTGDSLISLINWWTTKTENPAAVEGPFDPENCATFVMAGATFIESDHHIWTHPSGNMMQGVVNMLDAFERHRPNFTRLN